MWSNSSGFGILYPTLFVIFFLFLPLEISGRENELLCDQSGSRSLFGTSRSACNDFFVFWLDGRGGNQRIYIQKLDESGSELWEENGVPAVLDQDVDQLSPVVVPDDSGGVYVVYVGDDYRFSIFAQRLSPSGDFLWSPEKGVRICNHHGLQRDPYAVKVSTGGGIIALWTDSRNGTSDIYTQRLNSSGESAWMPGGMALSREAGDQERPVAIPDSSSGAIVCWEDSRNGEWDIYIQKVTYRGLYAWGWNGLGLCTYSGIQISPVIVNDGSDGAIVSWIDRRDGESDIYAQRVGSDGLFYWDDDGIPVCRSPGEQESITCIPDGSGGAIFSWHDRRGSDWDIYCARVDPTGNVLWSIPVCPVSEDQCFPSVSAAEKGGIYICWEDHSAGFKSVWSCHIDGEGVIDMIMPACYPGEYVINDPSPMMCSTIQRRAFVVWNGQTTPNSRQRIRISRVGYAVDEFKSLEVSNTEYRGLTGISPNPFNPSVDIHFEVPEGSNLSLRIFDVNGRMIRNLHEGKVKAPAGKFQWDGRNDSGRLLSSGVYFCILERGSSRDTRKLILLR